jgi:hypothetical protein
VKLSLLWISLWTLCLAPVLGATEENSPWVKILGPAAETKGPTAIYLYPRNDLNLLVAGTPLEPGMGLENRFEFQEKEKTALLKGRLVLMDGEIPKALEFLNNRHWKVEGLTHLFLNESPAVKSLQFVAEEPAPELAEGVRELLSALSLPSPSLTPLPVEAPDEDFQKQVESLMGQGQWKGRVFYFPLEAVSNTQTAGVEMSGSVPASSGAFYLQQSPDGAILLGEMNLPADEASNLPPSLTAKGLELTSWVRESDGNNGDWVGLRFYGKGSLEDMARDLNALRDQWKSRVPKTEILKAQ